jgi:hypothetical protein
MNVRRIGLLAGVLILVAVGTVWGEPATRSGYSYIRELSGEVTVDSRWNGSVEGRRNMPISSGDELVTGEQGRAEISLADGSVLHVGGGTRVRFARLKDQQGEDDEFSAVDLRYGSVVLAASKLEDSAPPRVDTDDATVYLTAGGRARVNSDERHGTVVIARYGSAEVRTQAGSFTVKAGSYLAVEGDEQPEVARGSFSRDRFDIWSADRFDIAADAYSAATRFVDEGYESDVVALNGNGDWSYNASYATNVWSPRVAPGWTPYSNGSWYYTPAGLTWLAYDPWGWYPFHYGSWFFDTGWNRWCWSPASVYSPAWVYWGFTGNYVGWCPIGWISGFYSPWWNDYYRHAGHTGRGNLYFAVHGTFSPRTLDTRGWNFTESGALTATRARLDVIPGSRIGDRLGSSVAITSRRIKVPAREGGSQEAVQSYVREAPRLIERTANPDSSRIAPILSRQRDLPPATTEALRDRVVIPGRRRLEGSGGADPRWRDTVAPDRGRAGSDPTVREAPPRSRSIEPAQPRSDRRQETQTPSENWRNRGRAPVASEQEPTAVRPPSADWRSRKNDVPPARRVIEGAVPGRRQEGRSDETAPPRDRERRPRESDSPRSESPRQPPRVEPRQPSAPPPAQPRPERQAPPPERQAPPRVERAAPPPAQSAPPPARAERPHKD